ncbi:MAG: MerR family DNA-binding transcriptional regulator [Thiotrichaceae bacterium]
MIKIGKEAKLPGISIQTLHKWEQTGELVPDRKKNNWKRFNRLMNQWTKGAITEAFTFMSVIFKF